MNEISLFDFIKECIPLAQPMYVYEFKGVGPSELVFSGLRGHESKEVEDSYRKMNLFYVSTDDGCLTMIGRRARDTDKAFNAENIDDINTDELMSLLMVRREKETGKRK